MPYGMSDAHTEPSDVFLQSRVFRVFVYFVQFALKGDVLLHEDFFAIVDVEVVFVGTTDQFAIEGVVLTIGWMGRGDGYRGVDVHGDAVSGANRLQGHAVDIGHGC